ncbi:hypothetical protein Q7C36_014742 [Tachysurus vachellii]|uniref:Uncharacterized protein n=1 Tax=Tachysurus vachellii TaxID=175792 RepID=A0AA88MB53_TACVA|nr:hypothetical protein Q7C36_014742 [Tachysurus vachellii]
MFLTLTAFLLYAIHIAHSGYKTKTDDDSDDKENSSEDEDGNGKKDHEKDWNTSYTAAIVGLSCVVVLLLVLLMWRFFTKRKAGSYLPAAPQAGISVTQNQPHIYASVIDLPEASQQADQQRESEAVYFLATAPASTRGHQKPCKTVYALADDPPKLDDHNFLVNPMDSQTT